MTAKTASALVNGWETVRFELLKTRLCDLPLKIEGSPVAQYVDRLYREMSAKKLRFRPEIYLTDGWGCPDEVPIIGIPFYLTDKRLGRLEEEQTGDLEDETLLMMLLRHETGHAINYAYRLWDYPGWEETFGPFSKPYRDTFRPNPFSKQFVRHIPHHLHGRTYAQKHPDEDFAETFAVWLTPKAAWRRKYKTWPALKKLHYVDRLMRRIRDRTPIATTGDPLQPLDELTISLAEHYGQRAERYREEAQGYVDDKLHEVFPTSNRQGKQSAADLLRSQRASIAARVVRWSGLRTDEVETILLKLESRADALGLKYAVRERESKLVDAVALTTALAMDFSYTGRLTG